MDEAQEDLKPIHAHARVGPTYGHQLDVLLVQELQRNGHVLQLHLAEGGPLVVLSEHFLLGQHLQEPNEAQPVAEVRLEVPDALVDAFEVLVAPARERVLLDLFPRRIFGQVLLRGGHFCVLVRGESVGSGRGALVEPWVGTAHFYALCCLPVRCVCLPGRGLLNSFTLSLFFLFEREEKCKKHDEEVIFSLS